MEVTRRCDLCCPFCFASSTSADRDRPFGELIAEFRFVMEAQGPGILQLSGGEPAVRDDLPELIEAAAALGFSGIQLNTNGLRLANETGYAGRLKSAGLSWVYLQFDGTDDPPYLALRGRPLAGLKRRAVENCAAVGLNVVLVATVRPGINADRIGDIVRFAVANAPGVRGVHLQPVTYLGRYPEAPNDEDRITLPEVVRALCDQTGLFEPEDFRPTGVEHPSCSFNGVFFVGEGGRLAPRVSRHQEKDPLRAAAILSRQWGFDVGSLEDGPGRDDFDRALASLGTRLTISAMAFQDAWTLDLERLQHCPIKVAHGGKLYPFCAWNLTAMDGTRLYGPGS